MAATTTLLGLVTPTQGTLTGTWGDTVNYGISDYVDISVAGTLTLTNDGAVTLANTTGSSAGSNITSTLTGAGTVTAQFAIVRVTGTLTVAKVVTGPSYSKTYTVVNAATGGIVTFKAAGQTGVSVAVGESAFVYFNGTDYVKIVGTATAGAAGGSNTQVQYNNSGVLAGITGATTNGTALTLVAPNLGSPASVGTMPAFTLGGTVSGGGNQINNVIIGTSTPLAGTFTQLDITAQGTLRLQDTTGGEYVALRAPASLAGNYTLTFPADDGTSGQALITDGSGVLSWSTAASGDVYGPGSSTDNAVARFDSTTGKLLQNSVVIIGDTGDVSGVTDLTASGSVTLSGGTANGVTYLNGSKVLTSGSALTFDGTTFGVNVAASIGSSTAKTKFYSDSTYNGIFNGASLGSNEAIYMGGGSQFFFTGGVETFRTTSTTLYTASGINVGFGETNPATTRLYVKAPSNTVAVFQQTGATGYGVTIIPGADTLYEAFVINNAANSANNIRMYGSGTATFAGNVGVNNPNPTSRLQILGTTSSYGITSVNPSGYGAFNFGSTTIPAQVWSFLANDNGANSDLQIYGGAAAGIKVVLDSAGNVGVNNTSPAVLASTTQVAIKANSSADAMFVAQNSNGLTTAKFGFQFTGGVDNPVIGSFTDHPFLFLTNNTERARFTGSAGGSLLVGTTSIRTTGYTTGNSQYAMENTGYGGAQWFTNRTDDIGSFIVVGKSRGTVVNSNTVVANGDELGALVFMGATGSGVASAAFIYGKVDGATINASSMPGRLSFHTTASGSTSPTERLRIANNGAWGLAGANYGTTGQVLTSQGSSAAPVWANIGAAYSATALVIAGGGGGGFAQGGSGGGGAGGYIETTVQFAKGSTYTVTVGAGGAGSNVSANQGADGGNSSVGGIASLGGGGGSAGAAAIASQTYGRAGGSGGGTALGPSFIGTGTAGQGTNGGYNDNTSGAANNLGGAGGGGAGVGGGTASLYTAGGGGNGLASSITGSSVTRGGGGGGGHYEYFSITPAPGGSGGGGNGSGDADPTDGTANTGGGGGGGGLPYPSVPPGFAGASGGSGVVILSIPTALYSGTTTGSPTVTTSGANTILTFNASGSYTA